MCALMGHLSCLSRFCGPASACSAARYQSATAGFRNHFPKYIFMLPFLFDHIIQLGDYFDVPIKGELVENLYLTVMTQMSDIILYITLYL